MAARRAALARGADDDPIGIPRGGPHADLSVKLAEDVRTAPEPRLRGTVQSFYRLRLGEQVARLPMPVLYACGDADRTIPIEQLLRTWAKYPKGPASRSGMASATRPTLKCPTS